MAFLSGLLLNVPLSARADSAQLAPPAPFVTTTGQEMSTSSLKEQPTLLWLLSTWCGSCAAGLHTLSDHAAALQKAGIRIVVLRNYKNDGFPGMSIDAFVKRVLPNFVPPKNWIVGQASRMLNRRYNGRHYPDIYYLIDAQGKIRAVGSAPSVTMNKILAFARNPASH
ncbi:redoxin domain-containing protein [Acidihalobacter ferrooxydans]|uniref:redoxin domain-containing protein n=1 Tax=Acidihalobacter ferrooxydans TaxID=1765967 RepID=UPI0018DE0D7E|nr:redoxin domain-containing protein [Acidihalobacter ferrooxydans]